MESLNGTCCGVDGFYEPALFRLIRLIRQVFAGEREDARRVRRFGYIDIDASETLIPQRRPYRVDRIRMVTVAATDCDGWYAVDAEDRRQTKFLKADADSWGVRSVADCGGIFDEVGWQSVLDMQALLPAVVQRESVIGHVAEFRMDCERTGATPVVLGHAWRLLSTG